MQPSSVNNIKLPGSLVEHMNESMSSAVSHLYQHLDQDDDKIAKIFNEYVFKTPLNEEKLIGDIQRAVEFKSNPLVEKELKYLHTLYNTPDVARLSSINEEQEQVGKFQQKMVKTCTKVCTLCGNLNFSPKKSDQPQQAPTPMEVDMPPSVHVDLSRFDAPAKGKRSVEFDDEKLAKRLQEEWNREDQDEPNRVSNRDVAQSKEGLLTSEEKKNLETVIQKIEDYLKQSQNQKHSFIDPFQELKLELGSYLTKNLIKIISVHLNNPTQVVSPAQLDLILKNIFPGYEFLDHLEGADKFNRASLNNFKNFFKDIKEGKQASLENPRQSFVPDHSKNPSVPFPQSIYSQPPVYSFQLPQHNNQIPAPVVKQALSTPTFRASGEESFEDLKEYISGQLIPDQWKTMVGFFNQETIPAAVRATFTSAKDFLDYLEVRKYISRTDLSLLKMLLQKPTVGANLLWTKVQQKQKNLK